MSLELEWFTLGNLDYPCFQGRIQRGCMEGCKVKIFLPVYRRILTMLPAVFLSKGERACPSLWVCPCTFRTNYQGNHADFV